jgi:hypothetical protein
MHILCSFPIYIYKKRKPPKKPLFHERGKGEAVTLHLPLSTCTCMPLPTYFIGFHIFRGGAGFVRIITALIGVGGIQTPSISAHASMYCQFFLDRLKKMGGLAGRLDIPAPLSSPVLTGLIIVSYNIVLTNNTHCKVLSMCFTCNLAKLRPLEIHNLFSITINKSFIHKLMTKKKGGGSQYQCWTRSPHL